MLKPADLVLASTSIQPVESVLGMGYSLLVSSDQTNGQYELMEFVVPAGRGAPSHIHRLEDESFFLLDGELEVSLGEQTICADAGMFLHLPRNVPHGFRNTSHRTSSFLCWVLPGRLAGFFDAFKRPWPEGSDQPAPAHEDDVRKMLAAAAAHDIEILDAGR